MIKMKGLRKKLNDFVKEKGNNLGKKYLGGAHIGDYLTADVTEAGKKGFNLAGKYAWKGLDYAITPAGKLGIAAAVLTSVIGCSTAKPKAYDEPKAYDGLAINLFDRFKATQDISAEELQKAGYKTWDEFVNAYKLYQKEGNKDANLTERTRKSDKRRQKATEENTDAFTDLYSKLGIKTEAEKDSTSGDGDDPSDLSLPNPEVYFHIGPFLETRHPNDTKVDSVDPYTITGFKFDLGLDKTFGGYFTAFGGSNSDIDMDNVNNGTGVSEITSNLTTFGLGGGINLFSNPYFRLGLEGGMSRNWESIDGTFTDTHGNTRDISASDYVNGYFLGAKATWKPFDWMALTFGANNTWFAKGESDNARRQWATNFALTFGGKF